MPRKYLRPWYVGQRWAVEAVATFDSPSGTFKRGDWVEIYNDATKKEAQRNATAWSASMHTQTRVVPGAGHKTRRGF
jgi:hypothetical protein